MKTFLSVTVVLVLATVYSLYGAHAQKQEKTAPGKDTTTHHVQVVPDADIAAAVRATSGKDCGCGECAAKGCVPCRGKNCYFCVAKGLTTKECGCGMCDPKGCTDCGPGCDVCKFHLKPLEGTKKPGKQE